MSGFWISNLGSDLVAMNLTGHPDARSLILQRQTLPLTPGALICSKQGPRQPNVTEAAVEYQPSSPALPVCRLLEDGEMGYGGTEGVS